MVHLTIDTIGPCARCSDPPKEGRGHATLVHPDECTEGEMLAVTKFKSHNAVV